MQPNEALAYLTQVCNDYARTLAPSAAMPFQQVAQDAVGSLAALVHPPEPSFGPSPDGTNSILRAVPMPE